MGILKKFQKKLKRHHLIAALGLIGLVLLVRNFSMRKSNWLDGLKNNVTVNKDDKPEPEASEPLGKQEYANAESNVDAPGLPESGQVPAIDPSELLPADENNAWSKLNPVGQGDLNSVNLLNSGHHNGINTVGSSQKIANLQIRALPSIPKVDVGPFLNSTAEPDTNGLVV